jgi:hypothetical protein
MIFDALRSVSFKLGLQACTLFAPAFYCLAEASDQRQQDAVIATPAHVLPAPGGSEAGPIIAEGSVVRVVRAEGKWTQIETQAAGTGWVANDAVVPVSLFKRPSKWAHPVSIEVGDGDYSASYSFKSDGSFIVSENVQDSDESYRLVKRRGAVYVYRGIVWARIGNQPPDSARIFVQKGKTLCWQGYLGGRCP